VFCVWVFLYFLGVVVVVGGVGGGFGYCCWWGGASGVVGSGGVWFVGGRGVGFWGWGLELVSSLSFSRVTPLQSVFRR